MFFHVKIFALPNNNKFALEAYDNVLRRERFVLVQYCSVFAFLNPLAHTIFLTEKRRRRRRRKIMVCLARTFIEIVNAIKSLAK